MKWLIKKLKQVFGIKSHEHKIVYQKGYGYRCKHCGKTKSEIVEGK